VQGLVVQTENHVSSPVLQNVIIIFISFAEEFFWQSPLEHKMPKVSMHGALHLRKSRIASC